METMHTHVNTGPVAATSQISSEEFHDSNSEHDDDEAAPPDDPNVKQLALYMACKHDKANKEMKKQMQGITKQMADMQVANNAHIQATTDTFNAQHKQLKDDMAQEINKVWNVVKELKESMANMSAPPPLVCLLVPLVVVGVGLLRGPCRSQVAMTVTVSFEPPQFLIFMTS